MQEFEFQVPPFGPLAHLDSLVESVCIAEGIEVGMKDTLASFPGSIHWHFKKRGARGTLEITFYPRARRLWASIQISRRGDWIEPTLTKIKAQIESSLMKDMEPGDSQ